MHICPNQGLFCARFAQPAFLCIKRRNFRRTRLSSTLCVRLHSSAGWLQGSPYRRFLLPPAFYFAGSGMLPRSNLGNRSWLRFSRSTPAGVCPACGHIHFASFYLPGDFVPHIRIMNTGYQTASLGNLFGLPYVVMRKPTPIDTTTLNYNGRSGRPMRSAFIPRKRTKLTSRAHRKPLLPCCGISAGSVYCDTTATAGICPPSCRKTRWQMCLPRREGSSADNRT